MLDLLLFPIIIIELDGDFYHYVDLFYIDMYILGLILLDFHERLLLGVCFLYQFRAFYCEMLINYLNGLN
jgi:hypothetical protein